MTLWGMQSPVSCLFVFLIRRDFQTMNLTKRGLKEHSSKSSISCTSQSLSSPPHVYVFFSPIWLRPSVLHLPSCLLSLWISCCPFLSGGQRHWRTSMSDWASCTLPTNASRHAGTKKIKIVRGRNTTGENELPEKEKSSDCCLSFQLF